MTVEFETPRFVCTWCALPFATRDALGEHWRLNPDCSANRSVSNPIQSKNLDRGPMTLRPQMPGEDVLAKVEAATRCGCCGDPDPNHDRDECEALSAASERYAQNQLRGI